MASSPSDEEVAACFSETYEEARKKFRAAAAAVKAELHALEVTADASGKYFMDIAVLRGRGKGLVVVSSGTHGVEGYAGSAVQVRILRQIQAMAKPLEVTVVLVHAVNPYGMAHFRRWNENNVDLNRNALLPEQFKRLVEHDSLDATYMRFDKHFNPTRPPGCLYRSIGVWLHMATNVLTQGLRNLKTALVAATYKHPKGIFFGGQELQRSHQVLRDFMVKHFSDVKASSVSWIDVHTGLGPCGVDVLMGSSTYREEMKALFPKRPGVCDGFMCGSGKRTTDDTIALRCDNSGKDAAKAVGGKRGPVTQAAGYELTVGGFGSVWVSRFFQPDSGQALVVTQEFGTLRNLSVARALMLENVGYHFDRENHEFWRTYTRDAFYVRTPKWKRCIATRGEEVFWTLMGRSEAKARS
eukprot:TRINITY_DN3903_c0_g1_i1.p1 TRINITY_DN3903_c0_g1~~TRINITY_DN3903_c0_g1_i1.p1  ORF type:complete len:433 (+),score=73.26 TRINITY_DN3903_c0_g1_i1:65-1300(+)